MGRAECLAKENKQLTWKQKQLEEANARNLALIEANSKLNDRVTNNATKENQKIHAANIALRRDPDGLRISAKHADPSPCSLPPTVPASILEEDELIGYDFQVELKTIFTTTP
ncbi:MAG TPA: hypothetical protein VJM47_04450 [Nitrosospira sp.]|nr:hypothetical protein [Nitrosospira sp.]